MTMTTCCGAERSTPFCPMCGKRLIRNEGLYGLLLQCRTTEKKMRSKLEYSARDGDQREKESILSSADKWKAWGDALAKLLEDQAESRS
jgi:hypothetical protein